jgi:hypothetical protein
MTANVPTEREIAESRAGAIAAPQSISVFDCTPKEMLVRVTDVANTLKDVITQQGFEVKIGAGRHLKVEGWSTLGMMMGFMPREKSVIANDDGSFTAEVEIVNVANNKVIGCGSGLCGDPSDSHWPKKPAHARRSMAITRATGRAYRLGMGWIVTLAGYSPTPAEEMPENPIQAQPTTKKFDMGNEDHCSQLASYLTAKKVSIKKWQRIETIMNGKDFTHNTVDQVISQLK